MADSSADEESVSQYHSASDGLAVRAEAEGATERKRKAARNVSGGCILLRRCAVRPQATARPDHTAIRGDSIPAAAAGTIALR